MFVVDDVEYILDAGQVSGVLILPAICHWCCCPHPFPKMRESKPLEVRPHQGPTAHRGSRVGTQPPHCLVPEQM